MALIALDAVNDLEAHLFALCMIPEKTPVAEEHGSSCEILVITAVHLIISMVLADDFDIATAI